MIGFKSNFALVFCAAYLILTFLHRLSKPVTDCSVPGRGLLLIQNFIFFGRGVFDFRQVVSENLSEK